MLGGDDLRLLLRREIRPALALDADEPQIVVTADETAVAKGISAGDLVPADGLPHGPYPPFGCESCAPALTSDTSAAITPIAIPVPSSTPTVSSPTNVHATGSIDSPMRANDGKFSPSNHPWINSKKSDIVLHRECAKKILNKLQLAIVPHAARIAPARDGGT